jgi:oleate hydratase
MRGENITIFETLNVIGGSLDAKKIHSGKGYVMTGHRILAKDSFECTYELLSHIPTLHDPNLSVKNHIDNFNKKIKTYAKARLVKNGKVVNSRSLGLSWKDRYNLAKVLF